MKKIIQLSFLSMISASGFASNLYVGGDVGLSFSEVRLNTSGTNAFKQRLGGFGVVGGGFAGYNFDFCQRYDLGIEGFIFGNSSHTRVRSNSDGAKFTLNSNYNYGLRILPGFYIMDCVETHLILGYTRANFKLRDNGVFVSAATARRFDLNGWQVGGGLRLDMGCNVSLRFDGVFNGYEHARYTAASGNAQDRAPASGGDYDFRVYTFDGTASLIYNF